MPKINPIQKNTNLIKKARSATYWLFGSNIAIQLISWAITVFVARILSPDDYGLFGMAALLTSFLVLFNELGLGPAIIQKKDLSKEQLSSCFWIIVVINISLFFIAFICAPFVASFFHEKRLTSIIRVAAISIVIGGLYKIHYSLLTKELMFNKRSIVDFVSRLCGGVSTLLLAILGYGVWSLVYSLIIGDLVKLILLYIFVDWYPEKIFSHQIIKNMIRFAYNVTGSRILQYFYSNSDYLIAGKFLGKTLLGYYSLAFQLASLPNEKLLSLIGQIMFPLFSKIQDDEITLRNYFLRIVKITAFIVFPIFTGMYLIGELVIILLLSNKWIPMILPFKILCLIAALRAINTFNSRLVYATGHPHIDLSNTAICSVIMPLGFLIGSKYGLNGISYAWLILYPMVFLITTKRSINVINISLLEYFKNLTFPVIATCFMAIIVELFKTLLLSYSKFFQLTFCCLIGMLSYAIFIILFSKQFLSEIKIFILR